MPKYAAESQKEMTLSGFTPPSSLELPTPELGATFLALQKQRDALNRKLQDTNLELTNTVGELDLITFYLNSILSHISQGLFFINLEGHITTCNAAAESLLGINSDQVIFQKFKDHFEDAFFGFSMAKALADKKVPKKAFAVVNPHGVKRELEIEATFVLHQDKKVSSILQGIIVLMRDITDLHHLQEAVQRRDRLHALGEMAAMVAHEIRNPLGSIKGFASLLERDLRDQPVLHRMANDIMIGADNLNRLVTNVLNYSRPVQAKFESTDLIALLDALCRQVEADESLDNRVRLELYSPHTELIVSADGGLLKSALLNLIANAYQAMPEGGTIFLSAVQQRDYAILKVQDTGAGISPENLKKLFSPFFTTKEKGNGFGLAEVHQVVQTHSGVIDVESTLGKGTHFTLTLPINH